MKKIINNPRKGVTLVELIVALSIVAIITVTSISIIHSAIKVEIRAASIIEANNTAESIVEIFRFTDCKEEFEKLGKLLDESFDDIDLLDGSLVEDDQESKKEISYIIDRNTYYIMITYYFYEKEINQGYKIEIDAYHSDGAQIYNKTIIFIKGQ